MEEEYKYIDSIRNFYKDMRNHLKPNGYIYIEKNIRPSDIIFATENNISINSIIQCDKIEHIRKVYDDIFQCNSNDNCKVNYSLDIVEGKKLNKLPFHIGKYYKWYDGRHRVIILKFPKGTSKTKKHSSKTKKNNVIKKTKTTKTKQ